MHRIISFSQAREMMIHDTVVVVDRRDNISRAKSASAHAYNCGLLPFITAAPRPKCDDRIISLSLL